MAEYVEPAMQVVDDTFTHADMMKVLKYLNRDDAPLSIVTGHDERNVELYHRLGQFEIVVRRINKMEAII